MVSKPTLHLFVCNNDREDTGLGPGCGARGAATYDRLKSEVAKHRLFTTVWVTATHCLGVCPKDGCTVMVYPSGAILEGVVPDDAPELLLRQQEANTDVDGLLAAMEELQTQKVIELAQRLRPGITSEDIKNPHDFPELDDKDWNYEDGVLTGIQAIRTALRAR